MSIFDNLFFKKKDIPTDGPSFDAYKEPIHPDNYSDSL